MRQHRGKKGCIFRWYHVLLYGDGGPAVCNFESTARGPADIVPPVSVLYTSYETNIDFVAKGSIVELLLTDAVVCLTSDIKARQLVSIRASALPPTAREGTGSLRTATLMCGLALYHRS